MNRDQAARLLLQASQIMFNERRPLMSRILPDGPFRLWDRYPGGGFGGPSGARCFYHVHAGGSDDSFDHGHFHFFLPRSAMGRTAKPLCRPRRRGEDELVHIIALGIDRSGLPTRLFAVNRWATGEWLYPADAIMAALPGFTLAGAPGDRLAADWLTALIHLAAPQIHLLLVARDAILSACDPTGEDRAIEVTGDIAIDIEALVAGSDTAVTGSVAGTNGGMTG